MDMYVFVLGVAVILLGVTCIINSIYLALLTDRVNRLEVKPCPPGEQEAAHNGRVALLASHAHR